MTPLEAIRKFCLDCGATPIGVQDCQGDQLLNHDSPCPLYKFRMKKGRPSVKVIREHCLYCCNGSYEAVRECPDRDCSLYAFRMGQNPNYSSQIPQGLQDSLASRTGGTGFCRTRGHQG